METGPSRSPQVDALAGILVVDFTIVMSGPMCTRLLADARREADAIVSRARADADRFRDDMKQQARDEAANIVANAEQQIQKETTRALAQLRQEAVDLSFSIASKVLRRTVTPADHQHLLDDLVTKLDQSPDRPA